MSLTVVDVDLDLRIIHAWMAEVGKNFRTAYYESLGFKEGEKQQSQLEKLLKADVISKETWPYGL